MQDTDNATFLEHLEALRWVLISILIPFGLFFIVGYCLAGDAVDWITSYGLERGFKLHYFNLMEPFFVYIKIAFGLSFLMTLPLLLIALLRFVAPAFQQKAYLFMIVMSLCAYLLFMLGGYFVVGYVLPFIVQFSMGFQTEQLQPIIGMGDFVSLIIALILGIGIVFELPLLLITLVKCGITSTRAIAKCRPYIVIAILIFAAIITPPDPISQLMVALPCYLLFEISLIFSAVIERSRVIGVTNNKSS